MRFRYDFIFKNILLSIDWEFLKFLKFTNFFFRILKVHFLKFSKIRKFKNIRWKYNLFSKICLADFKANQYNNRVFFKVGIEVGPII